MVKMLIFDLKNSEKEFLERQDLTDFEISLSKTSLNENTMLSLKDCDETSIISVFTSSKITKSVLEKFKNLRLIAVRSNSYENIDINACATKNIAVVNINNCDCSAVAQYVLGAIFSMSRNFAGAALDFKNKTTKYEKYEGRDITKLSLGVIGTGSTGSAVCKLAYSLGMKIYANDFVVNREINEIAEYLPFIEVLRQSDIITLHIPYSKDYHHLISYDEFETMKEGSCIINTSHGALIDTAALYRAILNNKLNGAALDVIECGEFYFRMVEANNINDRLSYDCLEKLLVIQELVKSPKVMITPNIAHNTVDSVEKILETTLYSIKDFFKGRKTNRVV